MISHKVFFFSFSASNGWLTFKQSQFLDLPLFISNDIGATKNVTILILKFSMFLLWTLMFLAIQPMEFLFLKIRFATALAMLLASKLALSC